MKIKCPIAHRNRQRLIETRNMAMDAARTAKKNACAAAFVAGLVATAKQAQRHALRYARQDRVQS